MCFIIANNVFKALNTSFYNFNKCANASIA